jgi:hypothetical protein
MQPYAKIKPENKLLLGATEGLDMDKQKVLEKIAKAVRIITVAPIMAAILIAVLYWQVPDFRNPYVLGISVLFLVAFPLLAYPLQPLIPGFKNKGREGQRNLAMLFAVIGYVVIVLIAVFINPSSVAWTIYLTYLLSAVLIALLNKVIHLKASGHACGVAGPVLALIWFVGINALYGLVFLGLVYWASIKTKRHKFVELLAGTIVPGCALAASILIVYSHI